MQGHKTYVMAGLLALAVVANAFGLLDSDTYQSLLVLLGAGTASTIAAKVNRVENQTK